MLDTDLIAWILLGAFLVSAFVGRGFMPRKHRGGVIKGSARHPFLERLP